MFKRFLVLAVVAAAGVVSPARADDFALDAAHTGVTFKISHIGLSWTYGRFNDVSGTCTVDAADPSKCAFNVTIKAESVDTGNSKRDEHLRGPDFFNAKQFPVIAFKSTAVKPIKDGYEVTGDFTMHGETKSITFPLLGGKTAEFPKGVTRTGFSTELVLKRGDFKMEKFAGAVGEDVHVAISFEATKK